MTVNLYNEFLKNKVVIAESYGFDVPIESLNNILFPHQRDIVHWAIKGGRRAIFANWGLGKSMMQIELANKCIEKTGKPFIIVGPLAVHNEFRQDNESMGAKYPITYITDSDTIENYEPQIFITNYERVRMGDIDASKFCGSSFDEASILRNLKTETTNYVISHFSKLQYRFVATATPTPNDLIEILNYAVFLGVISRGHALTRFFQRDSTKAGNLTLYPNKKKEFWQWVSTWAIFITKPSDLGYSDEGYILPDLKIVEHCIDVVKQESYINSFGELVMFDEEVKGLEGTSKEKRESIKVRCDAAYEISKNCESAILWHHLEPERKYLESLFKKDSAFAVYGSQKLSIKEKLLGGFAHGEYSYLLTKPKIAGSGCNLQGYCHDAIFVGIDYKYNDFIQAIHRLLRYGQTHQVTVHLLFTNAEYEVLKALYRKWEQDKELKQEMIKLIKEYGLNTEIIKQQMERQIFKGGKKLTIGSATVYNNDTVVIHADKKEMPDNSQHMILTSIPFGNHYEYSDNYNDFGHNQDNEKFFEQMDFLIPNLWRVLKPGRVAAIHVKDRIRYSYQNGTKFTSIDDFSGQTVRSFTKQHVKEKIDRIKALLKQDAFTSPLDLPHLVGFKKRIIEKQYRHLLGQLKKEYADRFYLMGKITVTTDVVRENNQTYRLGWTEQCKDATKMGCGMPEYVLLFRKPPTQMDNAYADEPVEKDKSDYDISTWQIDAHAYYRSSGDRFLSYEELKKLDFQKIVQAWKVHNEKSIYSFEEHLQTCQYLEEFGKLSKLFTTLPVHSNTDMVWTDVNRMDTLNAKQTNTKREKHICPLQIDIIKRLLNRYTMKGERVDDPFGGLFSTSNVAMEMGRESVSCELKSEYFKDGVFYLEAKHHKMNVPTLFDLLTA